MATRSLIELASTRSSARVKDNARIVIEGQDLLGFPYTEDAEVYDISQTGISFYLKNRPWIEDPLEITIFPFDAKSSGFFSCRKAKGTVVRTGGISQEDKQFVAARFEN